MTLNIGAYFASLFRKFRSGNFSEWVRKQTHCLRKNNVGGRRDSEGFRCAHNCPAFALKCTLVHEVQNKGQGWVQREAATAM